MSPTHTLGPWKAIETPLYGASAFYIEGSGKDHRSPYVAHIPRSTIQPMSANASLIAAAPDLLEALQLMLQQFTKMPSSFADSDAR